MRPCVFCEKTRNSNEYIGETAICEDCLEELRKILGIPRLEQALMAMIQRHRQQGGGKNPPSAVHTAPRKQPQQPNTAPRPQPRPQPPSAQQAQKEPGRQKAAVQGRQSKIVLPKPSHPGKEGGAPTQRPQRPGNQSGKPQAAGRNENSGLGDPDLRALLGGGARKKE